MASPCSYKRLELSSKEKQRKKKDVMSTVRLKNGIKEQNDSNADLLRCTIFITVWNSRLKFTIRLDNKNIFISYMCNVQLKGQSILVQLIWESGTSTHKG